MQNHDVRARSTASSDQVWELLIDAASWPSWSRIDEPVVHESTITSPDGRDGIGAVRASRSGKVVTRGRIVFLQPRSRFACEGENGLYLRNYQAVIDLSGTSGVDTLIHWRGSCETQWGTRWFWQRFMQRFMQSMADGLASHASARRRRSVASVPVWQPVSEGDGQACQCGGGHRAGAAARYRLLAGEVRATWPGGAGADRRRRPW
ncbi:SRPBCC family protein [Kineococcus auxinigenes]|uniref:SRPBCC family protein n=1 Tax=unclassified Kineococcus TaxID=2621656 RepID=UPI003D7DE6A9